MHERHVGEESDWADYIASLPTNFTVPAFWDVATLRLALGSPMVKEFFGDLVSIKPMLSTLEKRVFDSAPEGAFPTDSKTRFEYLLWALSVWHSRASHVPGVAHPVLVPGADFINDARSAPDAAQRAKRGDECAASPSGASTLAPKRRRQHSAPPQTLAADAACLALLDRRPRDTGLGRWLC